jgi:hypothetical protein
LAESAASEWRLRLRNYTLAFADDEDMDCL